MILPYLYFDDVSGRGRGMFSKKFIPEGKVIETAPVIIMTEDERKLLDQTLLHDYIFEWTPNGDNLCCMAQGYISVYNHSYTSNCEYFMDYETKTISIKTARDIEAGEELTINYNGDWNDPKPVWFDVV